MKFLFRDFWSGLIVKIGDFTYKSLRTTIFKNRRLPVEREVKHENGLHAPVLNYCLAPINK